MMLGACGGGGSGGDGPTGPNPNRSPTASFTLTPASGDAPLEVTADASASADPDGTIEGYAWDFAGNPAIGVTAQTTFEEPGEYNIQLTVTDNNGATATTTQQIVVGDSQAGVAISGTVQILSSSAIDSDVNDRLTTPVANNSFDQAQQLPTPVSLGGFANLPNTGEAEGNLFASGDPGDFYQLSLTGDEIIVLTIAETAADLDLRLWDAQRNLVDASLTASATESLEVPGPGTYFVEVLPFDGASNYALTIGQDTTTQNLTLNTTTVNSQRPPGRLSDPIIPGQLIVKAADHSQAGQSRVVTTTHYSTRMQRHGAQLVDVQPHSTRDAQDKDASLKLPAGSHIDPQLAQRWHTLMACKEMNRHREVAYAEPNLLLQAHATPNDVFFGSQWHYANINLPTAWDTTTGNADVIVAVIDTGVLVNHPDLNSKIVAGYDFISDPVRAGDGDGIDANPDDPGDGGLAGAGSFHGTHVAGTVAAETNNGQGGAGVAWETRIMPLRVLGIDGGTSFDVIQAVRFAAGLSNDSGTVPTQRADIINLSLGGPFSSQAEQDTYLEAQQAGVIIFASAGNDSSDLPSYPAAYAGVFSVSATTITNNLAPYSNFGPTIDVAAPGGSNITDLNGDGIGDGVISTIGDDSNGLIEFGYAILSGTSMAAPHVAGVAALMHAVHPDLTPAEFNNALLAGDLTDDLGSSGRDDQFGWGMINAQKAVVAAQQLANGQGSDPGPIITASASTLNFGAFLTQLQVTVSNIGTGTPSVTQVTSSEPWASVVGPGTGDGLGTYQINLDRSGLADNAYQATLTFATDANNVTVNLLMQVSSVNLAADAGLHYVVLVGEDNQAIPESVVVLVDDGEYPFRLANVPPGQSRLFAGTDSDDDAILCDAGEACGAYPALDSPEILSISADLTDLNFESVLRVNLTGLAARNEDNKNDPLPFDGITLHKAVNQNKPATPAKTPSVQDD